MVTQDRQRRATRQGADVLERHLSLSELVVILTVQIW